MNRRNVEAFRKLGRAVEMRAKFGGPGVACGVERNIIVLVNILRAYLVSDSRHRQAGLVPSLSLLAIAITPSSERVAVNS